MKIRALILGITGQDGSYLAESLLNDGYEVHGVIRRSSSFNTPRIDHIFESLKLHYGDITDFASMSSVIGQVKPHELYNLAAQSHVKVSFEVPVYTAQVDAIGTLNVLEAVRQASPGTSIYQASTSEMFGSTSPPQNEISHMMPRSPYGAAKLYAYHISRNYRAAYDMNISNGILFNHESPRRGPTFVTRKVTMGIGEIVAGRQKRIVLGNLDAKRDWGHAIDYVRAMRLIMSHGYDDFVVATGQQHTVREFVDAAFHYAGIPIIWDGDIARDAITDEVRIEVDERYRRPTEVDSLMGDASKLEKETGWKPNISFDNLVAEMVKFDIQRAWNLK